jgi:hypothetical protein
VTDLTVLRFATDVTVAIWEHRLRGEGIKFMNDGSAQRDADEFSFGVRELMRRNRRVADRRASPLPVKDWRLVDGSPQQQAKKASGFDPYNNGGKALRKNTWSGQYGR